MPGTRITPELRRRFFQLTVSSLGPAMSVTLAAEALGFSAKTGYRLMSSYDEHAYDDALDVEDDVIDRGLEVRDGRLAAWRDGFEEGQMEAARKIAWLQDKLNQMRPEYPFEERRPNISAEVKERIKQRAGFVCSYCRSQGTPAFDPEGRKWHIDHIIAWVISHDSREDNLCLACTTCNLSKHDSFPEEFFEKLERELGIPATPALADLLRFKLIREKHR